MLSQETLALCKQLLDGQQLAVGAPDFEETVTAVVRAKKEITAALKTYENGNRADRRAVAKATAKE